MWIDIEIAEHMLQNNKSKILAEYLNEKGVTLFHIIENEGKDLSGIGWVPDETENQNE